MLERTIRKIYDSPELLQVAICTRDFRRTHAGISSAKTTDRILGALQELADFRGEPLYETVERELPGAAKSIAGQIYDPLDRFLEAQLTARTAGYSERWIRKAMKHPESMPD